LITGRRVPANPLEVRTSPIVIDSSQSRPCATDYLRKLLCTPHSKVQVLRRLESVSAVQPHDQGTLDLSVVTEVSGLCDLLVLSVYRTPVHLVLAFVGGAGHRRAALRAGAPARVVKIRGDRRRPALPSCRPDSHRISAFSRSRRAVRDGRPRPGHPASARVPRPGCVLHPRGGDQGRHRYRPIASFT
jgi:hypothetical protein